MENIVTGLFVPIDLKKLPTDNKFRLIDFGLASEIKNKIIYKSLISERN